MMENTIQAQLEALHGAWCHATGQELHYKSTERIFYELHQMEFTPDDVRVVVAHLLRFNKNSSNAKFSLRANRVLGDLEVFSSTLAEAKAVNKNRRPAPTPKQQVQSMRERPVDKEQSSTLDLGVGRSFKDVLKSLESQ